MAGGQCNISRVVKKRRVVEVSELMRRGVKGGSHPRLWAYGYPDIAVLVGKTVAAVRMDASRRKFAPGDLASVTAYVVRGGRGTPS